MKANVTITDLTRMHGDRVCIAAYTDDGDCIRPLFRAGHITEDWLWSDEGLVIFPFAIVEFDLVGPIPDNPHTEDGIVERHHKELVDETPAKDRQQLLSEVLDTSVAAIFGTNVNRREGSWVRSGEGKRSLGTISPSKISSVTYSLNTKGKWDYRISFTDRSRADYRLAVVDMAFRNYLDWLRTEKGWSAEAISKHITSTLADRHVYLRIGLARGWHLHPDRCYLQITGIHTFPDYLDGRCFADF
jgi:hypothetical protein